MGGLSPEDLFSHFFGGGGGGRGGRPSGPRRGKDVTHGLKVTLEDLYKGKTTKLALQKNVICEKCEGKGGKEGAVKTCATCNGQGYRVMLRQMGPMMQQIQQPCGDCRGEGEIINAKDKCKFCNAKKVTQVRKVLEVHIDRGMKHGRKIVFNGEGDQAPGTIPGDVVIVLDQREHERFRRSDDDLFYNAKVDLVTALAGGKIQIPHLDDRVLVVDILPGEVIKPGKLFLCCDLFQAAISCMPFFISFLRFVGLLASLLSLSPLPHNHTLKIRENDREQKQEGHETMH